MAQINVVVPHQLGKEAAAEKLKTYSLEARSQFVGQVTHIEESWSEDGVASFSFRLMGFQVSGTTTTHTDIVEVAVKIPFAAIPIRGMIERELSNRLHAALG